MMERLSVWPGHWLTGIGLALFAGLAIFVAAGRGEVANASPGDCEYAQEVNDFTAGAGPNNLFKDATKALGFPDGEFVALGEGGVIILKFNQLQDGPGNDLRIWETVGDLETASISVSTDGSTFIPVGNTSGAVLEEGINYLTSIDIGNDDGVNYMFVKIEDDGSGEGVNELNPGFDLNSVAATNCGEPTPPPPGGEGCTPGYWRNHLDDWPPTGLSPTDDFDTTFGVDLFSSDIDLGEAVDAKGGGAGKIARHGTAGLLSALHPDVDYPLSAAEVIAAVQSGDIDAVVTANELGCDIS